MKVCFSSKKDMLASGSHKAFLEPSGYVTRTKKIALVAGFNKLTKDKNIIVAKSGSGLEYIL